MLSSKEFCTRINNTIFFAKQILIGAPTPACIAHTVAQYIPPPLTPLHCHTPHTMWAMAILCIGQFSYAFLCFLLTHFIRVWVNPIQVSPWVNPKMCREAVSPSFHHRVIRPLTKSFSEHPSYIFTPASFPLFTPQAST